MIRALTLSAFLTVCAPSLSLAQDATCDVHAGAIAARLNDAPVQTSDKVRMRAASLHRVGLKLCAAGERAGARRKFLEAERILGTTAPAQETATIQ